MDQLSQKEIAVIFLRQILNFQFLILLGQHSVVIIDILGYLGHGFKMLIEFFFLFFKVILIVFFLLGLQAKLLFDLGNLLV